MDFREAVDAFVEYLTSTNRSGNTIDAYRRDLGQLSGFLNGKKIEEINRGDLSKFMSSLARRKLTGTTRARKANAIRSFFNFLEDHSYLTGNPAKSLELPKKEEKEPRVLTDLEYRALRDTVRENPKYSAVVELLLQTGMRIGELVSLQIEDVDFGDKFNPGHIAIRQGKGKKDRVISLNTPAKKAIRKYLKARPKSEYEHLFLSRSGRPMHARNVRYMISQLYKKAGIKGATVHTLRHTFCTHHVARGTNLMVVAQMAGHSRLTTTQKYIHLAKEIMDQQIEDNAL
jgi:integrase/recombinase XerC